MTSQQRFSVTVDGLDHRGQPFPLASRKGPLVMTSGVFGIDRATNALPDDAAGQAALMFANLVSILEAAGASLGDVVRMTFYVADLNSRAAINEQWVAAFPDPASRPARHTLIYGHLPANAVMQCDAMAMVASDG